MKPEAGQAAASCVALDAITKNSDFPFSFERDRKPLEGFGQKSGGIQFIFYKDHWRLDGRLARGCRSKKRSDWARISMSELRLVAGVDAGREGSQG